MRTEANQLQGNQKIGQDLDLHGQIAGDATVESGATLHLKGQITGNLTVLTGGKAEIWGMVTGSANCQEGGQLICHPGSMIAGRGQ